ncbi:hypothetical protein AB6A40_004602 [Gnathostoma spinigerum]|uniref:Splicing factor 45 n=1 Tax=Gnathostoma spinigerum TaxID=75299 RepID=A0ABD6ELQ6_9BILA
MSLYDIFGEDPIAGKSSLNSEKSRETDGQKLGQGLPSSLRLLQSQIQLKKAQLNQPQRSFVPPVVDLSKPRRGQCTLKAHKAIPLGEGPPLSFIPKALKEDKVFLFGEILVEDEYNPTAPTDYMKHKERIEERKAKERVAKEIADRLHREHLEETAKRTSGAAIAPPQALMEADSHIESQALQPPPSSTAMPPPSFIPSFGGAGKGLGVAANIMSKFGYKEGGGLGRSEQGMSSALKVERMGKNSGMIVNEHEDNLKATSGVDSPPSSTPFIAPAPPPVDMAEALKHATRILLLRNMVGAEEIDDQLEPEVREEMKKYGQVVRVIVFRLLQASDEEAVRIFVEFTNVAQATKAFVDLNGRFFGGRSVRASFYDLDAYNSNSFDK